MAYYQRGAHTPHQKKKNELVVQTQKIPFCISNDKTACVNKEKNYTNKLNINPTKFIAATF